MADHEHTTALPTRRRILAGAGALAAAATGTVALAATMPTNPDADLLTLGQEFEASWAREREKMALYSEDLPSGFIDNTSRIVERILATPATSLAGLLVKARAVEWCGGAEGEFQEDPEPFGGTTDCLLVASIVHDLLDIRASGGLAHV